MNVEETIKRARAEYDKVVLDRFSAGNGTWSFAFEHDYMMRYPSTPEETEKLGLPELAVVLRLLCIDVYSFNYGTESDEMSRLGYYVADAR